jgi:hypothetical protein
MCAVIILHLYGVDEHLNLITFISFASYGLKDFCSLLIVCP